MATTLGETVLDSNLIRAGGHVALTTAITLAALVSPCRPAVAGGSGSDAQIAGDWVINASGAGCVFEGPLTLTQDGTSFSGFGTLHRIAGPCPEEWSGSVEGSVDGHDLQFGLASKSGLPSAEFTGTVNEDCTAITGGWTVADPPLAGSWSASRVSGDPCCVPGPGGCTLADSDGDGILDDWEIDGIPYEFDGEERRYFLPGADPQRKDLFLEVDAMTGFAPPDLARVVAAFANAPVANPDGSQGINLHLVVDETDLLHTPIMNTIGSSTYWPIEFGGYRDLHFGSVIERNQADAAPLLEAKGTVYRYAIIGDRIDKRYLGVAEDFYARNFIVLKGAFTTDPSGMCPSCPQDRIDLWFNTTFMHELGHCLNLRHGGGDDMIMKVNYISVMNYLYKVPMNLSHRAWKLDYSSGNVVTVNESAVDETAGLVDPTGAFDGRHTYYARVDCPDTACTPAAIVPSTPVRYARVGGGPVDFNGDGTLESSVCMDWNYYRQVGYDVPPTPCQTHADHDDWGALQYLPPPATPMPGPGVVELTVDEVRALYDTLPADCTADIAPGLGDGTVDVQDLLTLLADWGCIGACPGDIEPRDVADEVVDVQDLLALLGAWGACR